MSNSINGVEYQELLASASGSRNARRRLYLIAWDELKDFLLGLYGYSQITSGTWERVAPTPYQTGSNLYPKGHTVEGLACDGVDAQGNIHYQHAKLAVDFAPRDQQDEEDEPWLTTSIRSRSELIPIPAWGLEWASDSAPLDQDQVAFYPIGFEDLSIVKHHVASINEAVLSAYKTTLNNAVFLGMAIGCWRFDTWGAVRTLDADGETLTYSLTITLAGRSVPWDYFWRPNAGWAQVRRTDNTALFSYADFSAIGLTL